MTRAKDKGQLSGVYMIRNFSADQVYIGAAKYIKSRWALHRHELRHDKHHSKELQEAFNLDPNSLHFEVLEYCQIDHLKDREKYWIDFYGGPDSDKLYNTFQSKAVNKKISEKLKGNKNGQGAVFSESRRRKIGEASGQSRKGKSLSEEHKQHISESGKLKWAERRGGQS